MNLHKEQFASDNYSGICPEALEYMVKANDYHESAYGEDRWTAEVCEMFRDLFKTDCQVFFVFNGTAGNSLSISTLCRSYHSIISHSYSHIETDECGAPEFFSHGSKVLLCGGEEGKLDPRGITELVTKRTDIHYPKPKVISITQATELGTVYTPGELMEIQGTARHHGLKIQMDGARFANAVAALQVDPSEITSECGVDVLCFGGTKNGLAMGEAIIFFDLEAAYEFDFRCKQAGQLASKMRFLSAPWIGMLKNNTWIRHAEHANNCAALLAERLEPIEEISLMFPREANSVFIEAPETLLMELEQKGWHFYTFIGVGGARFMCSWDTTEEGINALVNDIKKGCLSN